MVNYVLIDQGFAYFILNIYNPPIKLIFHFSTYTQLSNMHMGVVMNITNFFITQKSCQ